MGPSPGAPDQSPSSPRPTSSRKGAGGASSSLSSLTSGGDSSPSSSGGDSLHLAAESKTRRGSNPDIRAVFAAAQAGDPKELQRAIKTCSDISKAFSNRDTDGNAAIHVAAAHPKKAAALVRVLLDAGADPSYLNAQGEVRLASLSPTVSLAVILTLSLMIV